MPAAYARTATQSAYETLPIVTWSCWPISVLRAPAKKQPTLIGGINTRDGRLTCNAVAEAHGLEMGRHLFSAHREPFVFQTTFCAGQKLRLLRLDQLKQWCVSNYEEIHLHFGWEPPLLAACEQKTETVTPATSPTPTTHRPPAATDATSPAATESSSCQPLIRRLATTDSPADTEESPAESPPQ